MLSEINCFISRHLPAIEMVCVLMRISAFTLLSWLGPESPFLLIWAFNTTDAILLTWCSVLKKDRAYTVLNVFWIVIGVVGIARALPSSAPLAH